MSDPYLWNQADPPDPFVEKLERALAPKRAEIAAAVRRRPRRRDRAVTATLVASTAAVIVLWAVRAIDGADPARPAGGVSSPVAEESVAPGDVPPGDAVAARDVEPKLQGDEAPGERAAKDLPERAGR